MNAKTSSSMSKAAQAILNGNCEDARKALQNELTNENQTADAWLMQAWTSSSFTDTEEALYRVLELDADNSLALNGLEWLSGIQEIAAGLDTATDSEESEDSCKAVAEETEEASAEETTEEEQTEETVAEETEEATAEETEEAVAEETTEEETVAEETEEATAEAEAAREEELAAEEAAAQAEAEEAARLADEAAEAGEAAEAEAAAEAEEKRRSEAQAELDRLNEEAEAKAEEEKAAAEEAAEAQRLEDEKAAEAEATAEAEVEAEATAEPEEASTGEVAAVAAAATAATAAAAATAATAAAVTSGETEVEETIQEDIAELSQDVKETIAQAEEVVAAEEANQEAAEARPLVLAVDDSPTIRKLLTMTLERQGFDVISAADGVEALTVLSEQLPDVILSDINMPRLGGYKLCKFVKKYDRTKHNPVIMLSGNDGVLEKIRGKRAGCNAYIVRPFE